MVRAKRTTTKRTNDKAQPGRRCRHARVYTAWHPVLVALLEHVLPDGYYQCISEFQLSREPLRIDVVIVRRSRPGTPPALQLLASVVADLADHTLVHFKGPTDELERDDARTRGPTRVDAARLADFVGARTPPSRCCAPTRPSSASRG